MHQSIECLASQPPGHSGGVTGYGRGKIFLPICNTLGLFHESSENFSGPKSQLSNCNPACFEQLIFKHVFNVRKTKRTAKFNGLDP